MYKAGDIIGFVGSGSVSALISLLSFGIPWWSLSHVGIIADYQGQAILFESTTLEDRPCIIKGRTVCGVQAHRIEDRLRTYRGKVWHYELSRPLFDHERERLTDFLVGHLGKPYDTIGCLPQWRRRLLIC